MFHFFGVDGLHQMAFGSLSSPVMSQCSRRLAACVELEFARYPAAPWGRGVDFTRPNLASVREKQEILAVRNKFWVTMSCACAPRCDKFRESTRE